MRNTRHWWGNCAILAAMALGLDPNKSEPRSIVPSNLVYDTTERDVRHKNERLH